jgi:hypothetical protein
MPQQSVKILDLPDALQLTRNAKIVSIRWDFVPWWLVLDCDVPVEEDVSNAPIHRAWIGFKGMSEISWPLEFARLPNGIFCTGAVVVSDAPDGFCRYELSVLAPTFSDEQKLSNNPHSKLIIKAKGLVGVISLATSHFGEFGPNRSQRNSLAAEEDFLKTIDDLRRDDKRISGCSSC